MKLVCTDGLSKIPAPTQDESKFYLDFIGEIYPLLTTVYGVIHGLQLYLEQSSDSIMQNMFYNG